MYFELTPTKYPEINLNPRYLLSNDAFFTCPIVKLCGAIICNCRL